MRDALIDGQQDVVSGSLGGSKQVSIFTSFQSSPFSRVRFVGRKAVPEVDWQAFIQKESSRDIREQRIFGFLERSHGHLARNGRELPQKLTQGMPAFKIVDQIPEGNTSATKTRRSVHYVGISHYHTLFRHNSHSIVNNSHQTPNSQVNTGGLTLCGIACVDPQAQGWGPRLADQRKNEFALFPGCA